VLFTIVLVASSEEIAKLCVHLSLYIWLKEKFGDSIAKLLAIIIPIFSWAILHTYRNPEYQGVNMTVAVATAFTGGLIMFAVMKWRRSIMVAILVHAAYNCAIIYMRYYGFGAA
jgi:membrane protease YdiL (CAAX protease family)